jgi:hypothetical protein
MANKIRKSRGARPRSPTEQAPGLEIPAWVDRLRSRHGDKVGDPARTIFMERAIDAVLNITNTLPTKALEETAAARNNFLVLLKALQSPEILPELEHYEPLASPFLKGLQAQQDLLKKAGGLMSAEEVGSMLNQTRQAVDKRRQAGKLIGIPQGQRGFGYPTCQFTPKGPVSGLDQMLLALGPTDAWGQLTFLINPNSVLDNHSPLDLLTEGHIAQVVKAATTFGEHGAL